MMSCSLSLRSDSTADSGSVAWPFGRAVGEIELEDQRRRRALP